MNELNLQHDQLLCEYNGVMNIFDLDDIVPDTIYLTKLHVEICSNIASHIQFTRNEQFIFTNMLVKNSRKTKAITALITLTRSGRIKPVAIKAWYIADSILEKYIDLTKIKLIKDETVAGDFIDYSHVKILPIKLLLNKVYRLLFRKLKCKSAIRSWVEISQIMYGDKYDSSLILIYPFVLNIKRHIRYIKHCFGNYKTVTLCGLPYSFIDYMKIKLSSKSKDLYCVRFELNAYKKHALELDQIGIKHLYTSDEFEVGAMIMVETLQNCGVEVTNTAHGMSFGCPYVNYDTFYVYNNAQKDYYSFKSEQVNFIVSPRSNTDPVNCVLDSAEKKKTIIFIEANYERLGMQYYTSLENRAVDVLREFGLKYSVDTYIKIHPNRKVPVDLNQFSIAGVKVIRHLSDIKHAEPIFVSFYSAAYYDFRHLGPFIFIYDGFVRPEEVYGEDGLVCAPLEKIDNVLLNYLN